MNFEDLLNTIEQLIGLPLFSINPTTPSIEVIKLDREKQKYSILVEGSKKESIRSFSELLVIWNRLTLQGYVNVDAALNGSGTSRNQPETIFANLPFIQHFKYQRKKHLLLRLEKSHSLGQLSELTDKETKQVKKQIDNQLNINFSNLNSGQTDAIEHVRKALSVVFTKYSGELELNDIELALKKLTKIQEVINDATVKIDSGIVLHNTDEPNNLRKIKLENLADSPEITGVDDGEDDDDDDDDNEFEGLNASIIVNKKSLTTPRIRQLNPTFSLIFDRLRYNELVIPEYQRKEGIWGPKEKAKLIESILLGLPLPIFYFAEKEDGVWIIVDGLQRITTMLEFINNEFSLNKLEELPSLNNLTFRELARSSQRKLREFQLTSYVIDMEEGNSRFISELFHRINTFGVKLSAQEIRNAVNIGNSVSFLQKLAKTPEFLRVTQGKINPIRQKDLEVCLSAVSYMISGFKSYSYVKQDDFLSETMELLNRMTDQQQTYIKNKFVTALKIAESIFGKDAFIKDLNPKKSSPISKPLFELIISVFSNFSDEESKVLIENKLRFVDALYNAIRIDSTEYASWESEVYDKSERGFNYSISQSTGKRVTVLYRFNSFINILNECTHIDLEFKGIVND